MTHEYRVLKNHIRRLLQQNRELSIAVAEERLLRKAAWITYWERNNAKWFSTIKMLADLYAGHDKAKARFVKDVLRNVK